MKKIWKMLILCMILCFFCAGCSNDDEMISEDHPKPTTEKTTGRSYKDRNRCRTPKETDE